MVNVEVVVIRGRAETVIDTVEAENERVGVTLAESEGLEVHEHGMWGNPEFYVPTSGGYGTESHSHIAIPGVPAPVMAQGASAALSETVALPISSEVLPSEG
jgi:hypothetical protein